MKRSTNGRVPQIATYPLVTCVDPFTGERVPEHSRDIPDVRPEPCAAGSWPAWTDLVSVRLMRRDFDLHGVALRIAEALQGLLHEAERCPDDLDAAMDDLDAAMPLPGLPDVREPSGWPDEPGPLEYPCEDEDDGPAVGYGQAPDEFAPHRLPPISGGSPEAGPFEPTPEDLQDLAAWSDAVAMRRWYDANPLERFNEARND
jgi:hypothetical protein